MVRSALGLTLIAAGAVLLVLGWRAHDSFASDVTRLVSGSPTKQSVMLLAGGAGLACAGLVIATAPVGKRRTTRR